MNMHWIDWAILGGVLVFILGTAIQTRRHMKSVADFLAANRTAGRYLLCIASGIAGLGAISVVAQFEMYYEAGFTAAWWMIIVTPLALLMALSGWVTYRYRETRVMTLAQFFEVRYSKNFRIFAGIVLWVSGIVNFGIFPAVGARFFIYFCGLPETLDLLGMAIPMFPFVMIVLLSLSLLLVFVGGQIAVMITDFFQGMLTNVVFLVILVALFWIFDWSTMIETLKTAPAEASLVHPFHTGELAGFNIWYFLIQAFVMLYGYRAWQGSQAYNFSARTAHEAKMAGILGEWRGLVMVLLLMMLPIGAYTVMHNPAFAEMAGRVNETLAAIENEAIRTQMTVPLALAEALPVGVVGLLCAVMLAAFVSTHDTYLHSWGSIFVQDVILPFRKKPFTPRQHLWLLRLSILFVAVFIFTWSMLFKQTEYILMFFALTGAIWLGGAGAIIIGGLYWKRGSTVGAWAALTTGAVVGITGIIMQQIWEPHLYPWMEQNAPQLIDGLTYVIEGVSNGVWGINWKLEPDKFPIDGQWINFFAMLSAIVVYITCSVIDSMVFRKPPFDMDMLLHRGKYTVKGDHVGGIVAPVTGWRAVLPTSEYTFGDKIIYFGNLAWTFGWFAIFIVLTVYNLRFDMSVDGWATFWWYKVVITVVIGVGTTIWFFIGGIYDIRALFRILRELKRNIRDDGRVEDHHIVADIEPQEEPEKVS